MTQSNQYFLTIHPVYTYGLDLLKRIYRVHPHSSTSRANRKTAQENFSRVAALAVLKI